jgi:drug/metabolite transporter (DMT)-like permease
VHDSPRAPLGVWIVLGLGLLSLGSSSILIRMAGDVPALAIAAWRTLFVTALVGPLAIARNRAEIRALPARDVGLILAAGVLLGLHFLTWIGSVQLTSIASSSVLVATSPLFIAALGALFLREIPSRQMAWSIGLAVLGASAIGLAGASDAGSVYPNEALGNGLAVAASLLVAVYFLIGRGVRPRVSFLAYFAPLNAVAALTALSACLLMDVPLGLPLPVLGLCLLMALGPGLLGHGSFTLSLRYLSAATLGLLTLAEPVLASLGAFVLFREQPSTTALAGMVAVLAAIGFVLYRPSPAPPVGESNGSSANRLRPRTK